MSKKMIIAIDGFAGAGKSTTAKLLAQKLGYLYIDTGAMYRAVTYLAIERKILDNPLAVIEAVKTSNLLLQYSDGKTTVFLNDTDITDKIRTYEINSKVSDISKIEEVRKELVKKQQAMGSNGAVVMEGRDITTVVFPNADLKIFLTASIEQRAIRRLKEIKDTQPEITLEDIKNNLLNRDDIDSHREISPLRKADDAIEIDTSSVTIDEQVDEIYEKVKLVAEQKGLSV
jgi:cytidylate kinase